MTNGYRDDLDLTPASSSVRVFIHAAHNLMGSFVLTSQGRNILFITLNSGQQECHPRHRPLKFQAPRTAPGSESLALFFMLSPVFFFALELLQNSFGAWLSYIGVDVVQHGRVV